MTNAMPQLLCSRSRPPPPSNAVGQGPSTARSYTGLPWGVNRFYKLMRFVKFTHSGAVRYCDNILASLGGLGGRTHCSDLDCLSERTGEKVPIRPTQASSSAARLPTRRGIESSRVT